MTRTSSVAVLVVALIVLAALFGTDASGTGLGSATLRGARLSFGVALGAVTLALLIGGAIGLAAGYVPGDMGRVPMRLADAQLPFPPLLVALLANGIARVLRAPEGQSDVALMVFAIALGRWPHFARLVHDAVRIERHRPYVDAARLLGLPRVQIAMRHVLPNVATQALWLALASLGWAMCDEVTLSYLGVGLPPTSPSLGALLRLGQMQAASGAWWWLLVPAIAVGLPLIFLDRIAAAGRLGPRP